MGRSGGSRHRSAPACSVLKLVLSVFVCALLAVYYSFAHALVVRNRAVGGTVRGDGGVRHSAVVSAVVPSGETDAPLVITNPLDTPKRRPAQASLRKLGSCYYTYDGPVGSLCVEDGTAVLYNAPAQQDGGTQSVDLCTGFPQKRPEGTVFTYRTEKAVPGASPRFAGAGNRTVWQAAPTLLVAPTLDTNLFHVVRDTLANLEDMLRQQRSRLVAADPPPGFVFLLPKHAAFGAHNPLYHAFFAAFTGGGGPADWPSRTRAVASVPSTERVCMTGDVYVGQQFLGYEKGPPARLAGFRQRLLAALDIRPPPALRFRHAAASGGGEQARYMLRAVERFSEKAWRSKAKKGNGVRGVNRKIGNLAAIRAAAVEKAGFDVEEVVLQDLPVLEQLRVAASSDVLLGSHGQALTWCLFMSRGSVCFELRVWKDARTDYPLIAKWGSLRMITIPLPDAAQVEFPLEPAMTAKQKKELNYYAPFTNYKHRQAQIIFPDIHLVEKKLLEAKTMLEERDAAVSEAA
eukprot:Rhum_TRINITY_DN10244_c0_g1::Rhum_TRINITY_DN10244_c0_g1_i1::g.37264::m.37264